MGREQHVQLALNAALMASQAHYALSWVFSLPSANTIVIVVARFRQLSALIFAAVIETTRTGTIIRRVLN